MTLEPGCSRRWKGLKETVYESWKDTEETARKPVKKTVLEAEKNKTNKQTCVMHW